MSVTLDGMGIAASQPREPDGHSSEAINWRLADQVFLDLEFPHLDVQAAIRTKDEALVWRAWRASRDQPLWLEGLASSVGSHLIERAHFRDASRTTPWHHVLIAWPLILPSGCREVACAGSDARKTSGGLLAKLQDWVGYRHEARLLAGVTEYAQVCRFSPLWQRECLNILAGHAPEWRAPLRAEGLRLPASFPRLAFVVGSISEWIVPPQVGRAEPGEHDWQLQLETAARIGYMHRCHICASDIGVPDKFSDAVLEGLRAWMRELFRRHLLRGWHIDFGYDDTVVVELTSAQEDSSSALIPLRLHQIGMQGLELLLQDLQQQLGPASARCQQA
jgi:hypothetical protein